MSDENNTGTNYGADEQGSSGFQGGHPSGNQSRRDASPEPPVRYSANPMGNAPGETHEADSGRGMQIQPGNPERDSEHYSSRSPYAKGELSPDYQEPMPNRMAPGNDVGDPRAAFALSWPEYSSARKYITAAQIMALVSLLIGGVVLSGAAIVVAIIGYRKAKAVPPMPGMDAATMLFLLRRAATVALVVSVLALGVNIAALVFFYPRFIEMLQTGDYASTFGFGGFGPTTGSGSAFWG